MIYQEIQPTETIKNYIHSYWKFEVDANFYRKPFQHSIMADGCTSLAFIRVPGVPVVIRSLTGPTITNIEKEVPPGMLAVGIRFKPPAQYYLLNVEGKDIRDKDLPADSFTSNLGLDDTLQNLSDNIIFEQFDKQLTNYLNQSEFDQNHSVNKAVQMILETHGQVKISDVILQSAMSERHLQREFKRLVGLTLKEFSRVRRIRSAAIQLLLDDEKAIKVAHDSGFYDRSHLNNEFAMIVGDNPGEFREYIKGITHLGIKRE